MNKTLLNLGGASQKCMDKMSKIDAEFLEKVVSGLTLKEAFSGKASKSKFSSPFVQHLFDYSTTWVKFEEGLEYFKTEFYFHCIAKMMRKSCQNKTLEMVEHQAGFLSTGVVPERIASVPEMLELFDDNGSTISAGETVTTDRVRIDKTKFFESLLTIVSRSKSARA